MASPRFCLAPDHCIRIAHGTSLLGILVGGLVLCGWIWDVAILKSILPGAATMKPNTALGFLLVSVAIGLEVLNWRLPATGRSWKIWTRGCAVAAFLLSIVTIATYAQGWPFSLDTWWFSDAVRAENAEYPGRMSIATALGISLLALGILTTDLAVLPSRPQGQFLLISGALIGYIALAGYAFEHTALYENTWFSSVSLPTATLLFVLGIGALCVRPNQGIMTTVCSPYIGGWMGRRLLPTAMLLPLVLGWLRLVGERASLFHPHFGLALLTACFAVLLALVIWRQAKSLNHSDQERQKSNEANARLAAIVDSSGDAIIGMDLAGRVTSWNNGATQLFGYTAPEMLGQSMHRLLPPDRLDEEDGILASIPHRTGIDYSETERLRKDGKQVAISLSVSPIFDSQGQVIGASQVARDITERLESEKRLRVSETRFQEIAENIDEVLWTMDPVAENVDYVSSVFGKIWGIRHTDLLDTPHAWIEAIPEGERAPVTEALNTKLANGQFNETYRIIRPDGNSRWIRHRMFPLRDQHNVLHRYISIASDITQHRSMEKQLNQAQKLEALGTLAGGIAHDFNNILSAMLGYTELAKKHTNDVKVLRLLEPVTVAGERATSLIKQILSFSLQEEDERAAVQLRHIVEESLKLLRATIPTNVQFDTHIADSLPLVKADESQIHQIMMNLCTNAWHAMIAQPTARLTVKLEPVEIDQPVADTHPDLQTGSFVRLIVEDNGKGMDRETVERVFEPFYTTKAPGEGTGLGLSVVHGIIKSHGGAITVYSHLNEGTCFQVYLPVLDQEAHEAVVETSPPPTGHGERVLFVDDELTLAKLGAAILDQLGYTTRFTTDSMEALEYIKADPTQFDLVVTDMAMPHLTGMDLARSIHEIRPDLPIILTSGYIDPTSSQQFESAGISDVIPKPPSIQTIARITHRVLQQRKPSPPRSADSPPAS